MPEPIENQYMQIGHIAQPHGVDGTLLLIPDIYAPALFDKVDLVHIENERGDLVPARIELVRVQEKNDRLSFFIKFEHITDRTQAIKLKHRLVFAERDVLGDEVDEDTEQIDFTSFEIWLQGRHFGRVISVMENPAHPILEVYTDAMGKLLVPMVNEYVTDVNIDEQKIYCQHLQQLRGL